jgi:TolA-binding protein
MIYLYRIPKVLQQEIRQMQTTINRLNHDVVELTQHAEEHVARRLRDNMQRLNENWSHIISSNKAYSQNIQVSYYLVNKMLLICQ